MSMNLHVCAKLLADTKLGQKTIAESFNLWQTPTDVTRECLASGNPMEEYKKWVIKDKLIVREPIYARGDLFGEDGPIGYEEYCAADDHLESPDKWLLEHDGWEICWFEL